MVILFLSAHLPCRHEGGTPYVPSGAGYTRNDSPRFFPADAEKGWRTRLCDINFIANPLRLACHASMYCDDLTSGLLSKSMSNPTEFTRVSISENPLNIMIFLHLYSVLP